MKVTCVIITTLHLLALSALARAQGTSMGERAASWYQLTSGWLGSPDLYRNVTEMIRARGFGVEEHWVTTEDGYMLLLQRIINPLAAPERRNELRPVILQHGLLSNQVDFVVSSPNVRPVDPFELRARMAQDVAPELDTLDMNTVLLDTQEHPNALAFYLANRGYDVFLSSSRGSTYGTGHATLSTRYGKYWDFSFDELIKYDLPAVIDRVKQITCYQKVGYVGHSQGSIIMFGLLSDRPEYAQVVEPFVALAPVAYIHSGTSPTRYLFMNSPNINIPFLNTSPIMQPFVQVLCGPPTMRRYGCANLIHMIVGEDMEELDMMSMPARMSHMPGGSSFKNIQHYGQEARAKRFGKYDYGPEKNMQIYGQPDPPSYNISHITSKSIVLFTADNDLLSQPADIEQLKSEFTVPLYKVYNMTSAIPKYNHVDFVYGKHAGQLINRRVAYVLDQFPGSGGCGATPPPPTTPTDVADTEDQEATN